MDKGIELAIKQECAELVADYSFAVNDRDLEAFAELFTDDAVWQRPNVPPLRGRAEIRAFMARRNALARVQRHVNGAVRVVVRDADHAAIRSQCIVFSHAATAELPAPLDAVRMVVEYADQAVRTERGFRFQRRDTTVVFSDAQSRTAFAALADELNAPARAGQR